MSDDEGVEPSKKRIEAMKTMQALASKDIEIEELKPEIASLKKANGSGCAAPRASKESEVLKTHVAQLNSRMESLKDENNALTADKQSLKMEIDVPKAENEALKADKQVLHAEEEPPKTSYLDTVCMESPKVQEYVQQQVNAVSQTRIDEEVSKALDEYFEEENSWIWKTEPRIMEYVSAQIKRALGDYFDPKNDHIWKNNPRVSKHVEDEVAAALEKYFKDTLKTDKRFQNHINNAVNSALEKHYTEGAFKEDESFKTHATIEVGTALAEERAKTGPLLKVSRVVRLGHIEKHVEQGRNKKVIEAGTKEMHESRPAADATLFLDSTVNRRTDNLTYRHMYGVDWTTFWRLKDCIEFAMMVQMYGSVKFWHPDDFFDTGFFKALPDKFGLLFRTMSLDNVRAYFKDSKHQVELHELREWFAEERASSRRNGERKMNAVYRRGVTCYGCGEEGHFARECPNH